MKLNKIIKILMFLFVLFCFCNIKTEAKTWNISLNHEVRPNHKVKKGSILVIDAQNYNKTQIQRLKQCGYTIYSYLNIGSVESNRSYYKHFKKYKLKTYENWEDEYWINVNKKEWQNFVDKLSSDMVAKGVDGFWVDNTDVYEYNKKKTIYNGLIKILKNLRKTHKKIILNGGDQFVTPMIKKGNKNLIDGVVQEEVFTRITNYSGKGTFKKQRKSFKNYYLSYFKFLRKNHLSVGVLEYTRNGKLKKNIKKQCKKYKFNYCIKTNIII